MPVTGERTLRIGTRHAERKCTGCFPEPAVSYRKKSTADLPPTPQARCEADFLGLMFNSKCDIAARSAVVVGAKVAVPWPLALLPLSLMDGRLGPTRGLKGVHRANVRLAGPFLIAY